MGEGLVRDLDTHVLRGPFDLAHGRFDGDAVQIWEFLFSDFTDLGFGHLADLVGQWLGRTLLDLCCLLQEFRDRRGLEDEGVGAIFVEGDDGRHDFTKTILGCGVNLLTEFRNVHAVLTEGWTKWRGWGRATTNDLHFNKCLDFLCHIVVSE